MTDPRIEEQVAAIVAIAEKSAAVKSQHDLCHDWRDAELQEKAADLMAMKRAKLESTVRAALVEERERALEDAAVTVRALDSEGRAPEDTWEAGFQTGIDEAAGAIRALRERP